MSITYSHVIREAMLGRDSSEESPQTRRYLKTTDENYSPASNILNMCLSFSRPKPTSPQIQALPTTFLESFPPSQSATRGNTSWATLFSSSLSAGIASCPPNGTLGLHRHRQAELYHILSGSGRVEIEGEVHEVKPGMTLFVPGDAEHGVRNEGSEDLRWLYVFPGEFEKVKYRFRED